MVFFLAMQKELWVKTLPKKKRKKTFG